MPEHPFAEHWPALLQLAESGGIPAVVSHIEAQEDPQQRRGLFSLASGKLSREEWPGRSLDSTIEIARAAIAEGVRQAEAETDPIEAGKRTDFANVLSYNLSADLADCWPNDERPREKRHFEAGLAAAEDCLRWREQLGKGPFPFSIAWWAHGMHALSLGDAARATESFEKSLHAAQEVARGDERATDAGADATFGVNLGVGYLGLARMRAGDPEGQTMFDSALAGFAAQKESHPEEELDADFGVSQLHTAELRTRG